MPPTATRVRYWFSTILLLSVLMTSQDVDASGNFLDGEWSGSFSCGEFIDTSFTLTLGSAEGGLLTGELHFTVPRRSGETGAYRVRGRYDAVERKVTILPTEWIKRQPGLPAIGLSGTVHENGLSMQGELRYCQQIGHPSFIAKRSKSGPSSTATETGVTDKPLSIPSGGPLEGHWKGSITCTRPVVEIPLDFNILGSNNALAGMATINWPYNQKRQVLYQEQRLALRGQAATGEVSLHPTVLLGKWPAQFQSLTGRLDPSGKRLEGTVERPGAAYNCKGFRLALTGPPNLPNPKLAGLSAGSWAGYEFELKSTADRLEQISELNKVGTMQTRLTLVGEGVNMHGRYEVVSPLSTQPTRQDRYRVRLRPLLTLEDGRIGFVPMEIENAEGRLAGQSKRGPFGDFLLAISKGSGNTIMIERLVSGRVGNAVMLHSMGTGEIAALDAGEGPRIAFPESMGGRLVAAPSFDAQCRVLRDWLQPLSNAGDLGRMTYNSTLTHALPLFTEKNFAPVFGLPYQQTAQPERSAIVSVMALCATRIETEVLRNPFINRPLASQAGFDEIAAKLMDRQESGAWLATSLAEVDSVAESKESMSRLNAIEVDARRRDQDLQKSDRERLAAAIAGKRNAIAVAVLMDRVAAVPNLPTTTASISVLNKLIDDSRKLKLSPEISATLDKSVNVKAKELLNPIIDEARNSMRDAPKTLEGLAVLTRSQRMLKETTQEFSPYIVVKEVSEVIAQVRARREELIASPEIRSAFTDLMQELKPQGDPRAVVHSTALRYVDEEHLNPRLC